MTSTKRAKSSIAQRALDALALADESESSDDDSLTPNLLTPSKLCVICCTSPRTHIFVPCVSAQNIVKSFSHTIIFEGTDTN